MAIGHHQDSRARTTPRPDAAPASRAPALVLEIPPRPENVGLVRQLVRRAAAMVSGLDQRRIDHLIIAVSEACTNAVEAHLASASSVPVRVECRPSADRFEIAVHDRGGGFDPDSLPARPPLHDPEHLKIERGWGIQLMRSLVDEVRFVRSDDGMIIQLAVHTPAAERADA